MATVLVIKDGLLLLLKEQDTWRSCRLPSNNTKGISIADVIMSHRLVEA